MVLGEGAKQGFVACEDKFAERREENSEIENGPRTRGQASRETPLTRMMRSNQGFVVDTSAYFIFLVFVWKR